MARTAFWLATLLLAFNAVRPFAFPISIPDALYSVAFLALIGDAVARKRPIGEWLPFHPLWLPSYLVVIGGLVSSMNAVSAESSIRVTLVAFYVFTFWTSMTMVMARRGHIEDMITALVLGAVFSSVVGILDFLFGTQFGQMITDLGWGPAGRVFYYRASGTMGHPNELAMLIAVVAPVVLSRVLAPDVSFKVRLANALSLFLLFLALVFAGSGTGLLGVGLSCVIVLFVRAKSSHWLTRPRELASGVLLSLTVPIVLTVLVFSSPLAVQLDIADKLNKQEAFYRISEFAVPTRIALMQDSLEYIAANPLWGAGMDQTGTGGLAQSQLVTSTYVHNTLLAAWLAGGLVVFVALLALYWQVLRMAVRGIVASLRGNDIPYVIGLSASSIGWIAMDMVQPAFYQRYKWLVAALLFGVLLTQKKSPQRHPLRANSPGDVEVAVPLPATSAQD